MEKDSDLKVLVVMPAHNEEETICDVLRRLKLSAPRYDIVVVNDGSSDRTGDLVNGLGIKQILLQPKVGYGKALRTGLNYGLELHYDVIVCMDADGQHDPTQAKELVDFLVKQRADLVIGSRFLHDAGYKTSTGRRIGMILESLTTALFTGHRIYDTTSGYKAMTWRACSELVSVNSLHFHAEAIVHLIHSGFVVKEYPVIVSQRTQGKSMYSPIGVLEYALKQFPLMVLAIATAYSRKLRMRGRYH